MKTPRLTTGLLLAIALGGCDSSTPTKPTPISAHTPAAPPSPGVPPTPSAPAVPLKGTMTLVPTLTATGGYQYAATLEFRETTGFIAKIKSVAIAPTDAWGPYPPIGEFRTETWAGGNVVPANGSLTSPALVATVAMPDGYYHEFIATVVFSYDMAVTNRTIDIYGTSPPMPVPPPGARFTMAGTVVDELTRKPVSDVTVEVVTGDNAGRKGTTDAEGKYRLDGLKPGTFDVGYSKIGYKPTGTSMELYSNIGFWTIPLTQLP